MQSVEPMLVDSFNNTAAALLKQGSDRVQSSIISRLYKLAFDCSRYNTALIALERFKVVFDVMVIVALRPKQGRDSISISDVSRSARRFHQKLHRRQAPIFARQEQCRIDEIGASDSRRLQWPASAASMNCA
jgi:hypothetical protein